MALGHLDLEGLGGKAGLVEGGLDLLREIVAEHLRPREVHGQAQAALLPLPGLRLQAGRAEDPGADGQDQAGEVGLRKEVLGKHEAELGVLPAQKRLDPRELARGHGVERLVVQHAGLGGDAVDGHAPASQGRAQSGLELHGVEAGLLLGPDPRLEAVSAARARLPQGGLRGPHQAGRVVSVVREHRHPHAGGGVADAVA